MVNTLTPQEIDDLVAQTLKDLGRGKIVQIAQNQSSYEIYGKWFKKDKMTFSGGMGIKRTLHDKLANAAKHRGLYEEDSVNVVNLLTSVEIPWVFATTAWGYVTEEMEMNKGEARINNIIVPRRNAAVIDLVELIESKGFSCPTPTETELPYGLAYWIVGALSTSTTPGFDGACAPGHSTIAGLNPTLHPNYKNYNGLYSVISEEDLIPKLRTAFRRTYFKSPVDSEAMKSEAGRNFRIYVNEETVSSFEALLVARNSDLGSDLGSVASPSGSVNGMRASSEGDISFKRHPIIYAEQLDSVTSNPIFGVNHSSFYPVVLSGSYLRETPPKQVANQHNGRECFIDLAYNYFCENRRLNWRFDLAA